MFFKIDVLDFAIFRGKNLCLSLFLIKLQVCNFPVNIAKNFKSNFLRTTSVALLFHENVSGGAVIDLINMTK